MRKHVDFELPAFAELATGPTAVPAFAQRVLASQPVGYWRSLDGQGLLGDASGQGRDGTVVSGQVSDSSGALFRDADPGLSLSQARIEVPSHPSFSGFADFTLMFWLRLTQWPGTGAHYMLCVLSTVEMVSEAGWAVVLRAGGDRIDLFASTDGNNITQQIAPIPRQAIGVNQWRLLTWRRSGDTVTSWVDGQWQATSTFAGSLHNASAPLVIGDRGDAGLNTWLGGELDEIALFDVALPDVMLTELHELGRGHFRLSE